MWLTTNIRYTPLLPSNWPLDRNHRASLVRRGTILAILGFVVVVIIGAALAFDLRFAFASKRPDIVSPETSATDGHFLDTPPSFPSLGSEQATIVSEENLSMDEMKAMVEQTKGFYTRDYSLGLGWNNVRYIIEASALQARLLNRTLILPSFVYARSCVYEISVCADEALMVNKGDAIGWDNWRDLPIEEQMGWQIPISMMINITQLRQFQPAITTAEYLQYAGLPPTVETTSGYWNRNAYHRTLDPSVSRTDDTPGKPTLFVIENAWYDPEGVTRVDSIPEIMKDRGGWVAGSISTVQAGHWDSGESDAAQSLLKSLLRDKNVVEWDEARNAVKALAIQIPDSVGGSSSDLDRDEFIEDVLNLHGWEVLHTFQGAGGTDLVKHVVIPMRQVALRTSIRGFVEDYQHIDADIVVLAGETHLYRKPGQMRFTTQPMQEWFQRLVVHHVVPRDKVYELARKLDLRISAINSGRQWMGAHIRRGDFVTAGWSWGKTHMEHLDRVKEHLAAGRKLLGSEHRHTPYSIPDIIPDTSMPPRDPPAPGDKFYIATDESDPEKLEYFFKNGAIMFHDLITFEDRHEFGWGILFSDIIGLVEQATLARGSYFYGSALSSFTGGVFNMRAVLGAEEATALAD